MAKFGTLSASAPRVIKTRGKGGARAFLPNRIAVNEIMNQSPMARSINDYAKVTPSGANAPRNYSDIMDMAKKGAKI